MGDPSVLALRPILRNAWSSVRARPLRLWAVAAVVMIADGSCLPGGSIGPALAAALTAAPPPTGEGDGVADVGGDPLRLPSKLGSASDAPSPVAGSHEATDPEADRLLGVLCFVLTLFLWALTAGSLATPGCLRVMAGTLNGHGSPWRAFRSGFGRFKDMLAWTLLAVVIQLGAALIASLPGALVVWIAPDDSVGEHIGALFVLSSIGGATVWVALGLFFGPWFVALEDMPTRRALRASWRLADGRRVRLLLLVLAANACAMASLLGVLLCGVGLLVSVPLGRAFGTLTLTDAFRRMRLEAVPGGPPPYTAGPPVAEAG